MKLLLDENLSPRLLAALSSLYPESDHVHNCGLGAASDETVWEYAKVHKFTIVSKDSDFSERSILYSSPPKVVWIRIGNCSTAEVEKLLRSAREMIRTFIEDDAETCLLLNHRQDV